MFREKLKVLERDSENTVDDLEPWLVKRKSALPWEPLYK